MKKTYIFEQPFYSIEVVATGAFCIFILVACIGCFISDTLIPRGLCIVFGIAAAYQAWNTFVSLSNPERVTIDEDEGIISFSGFGRSDIYEISKLSKFLVRPFPSSGKTFIRVNDYNAFKGRYWVPTKMFNDSRELFDSLCNLEYKIHPDSLKARARDVNQEYIDHAEQIKQIQKSKRHKKNK
jgi:hypothetical protein